MQLATENHTFVNLQIYICKAHNKNLKVILTLRIYSKVLFSRHVFTFDNLIK